VLNLLLAHRRSFVLTYLPNWFHHSHEVLVWGKRHGKVSVVIVPFLFWDSTIVVAAHAVKSIEELREDLISCLFSFNEVLVLGNVIDCVNVWDLKSTAAVAVNRRESLVNHVFSALRKGVSKSSDELLVANVAITINIVILHEPLDFHNFREEAESWKSLSELFLVQLPVSVVVHLAENDSKRANTDSSTLLDLHFELIVDSGHFDIKANPV